MMNHETSLWLVMGLLGTLSAHADQVILDDAIVVGGACVGLDCANAETFSPDEVKLKENNTRIRLDDTLHPPGPDQSWYIEANSSRNGGASYFDFQLKSFSIDNPQFAAARDGAVPEYDCATSPVDVSFPAFPNNLLTGGTIPLGGPILAPQLVNPISCPGGYPVCEVECVQAVGYQTTSLLTLGAAGDNLALGDGVAIGYESAAESGVISVGRADLVRRLVHVAAGLGSTDALTQSGLGIPRIALLEQQIVDINQELDLIEEDIRRLEACDVDFDGDIDRTDVRAVLGARGQAASGPDDRRDADGDGVITRFDASLCARRMS